MRSSSTLENPLRKLRNSMRIRVSGKLAASHRPIASDTIPALPREAQRLMGCWRLSMLLHARLLASGYAACTRTSRPWRARVQGPFPDGFVGVISPVWIPAINPIDSRPTLTLAHIVFELQLASRHIVTSASPNSQRT